MDNVVDFHKYLVDRCGVLCPYKRERDVVWHEHLAFCADCVILQDIDLGETNPEGVLNA